MNNDWFYYFGVVYTLINLVKIIDVAKYKKQDVRTDYRRGESIKIETLRKVTSSEKIIISIMFSTIIFSTVYIIMGLFTQYYLYFFLILLISIASLLYFPTVKRVDKDRFVLNEYVMKVIIMIAVLFRYFSY